MSRMKEYAIELEGAAERRAERRSPRNVLRRLKLATQDATWAVLAWLLGY